MASEEWKPKIAESPTALAETGLDPKILLGVVFGGIAILCVVVIVVILVLPRPLYTEAADPKNYWGPGALGSSSDGLVEKYKIETERKYSLNFSKILTARDKEKTSAMKAVANLCLPTKKFKTRVMAKHAFKPFQQSTEYLVCAMEKRVERLCKVTERKRLVEQLMEYRIFHQHVLGYESGRRRVMAGALERRMMALDRKINESSGRPIRKPNIKITNDLDSRITSRLTALTQKGFMAPEDFGWLGLVLPAEYAPSLSGGGETNGACG